MRKYALPVVLLGTVGLSLCVWAVASLCSPPEPAEIGAERAAFAECVGVARFESSGLVLPRSQVSPSIEDLTTRVTAKRELGEEVFAEAQKLLPERCREEYHCYSAGEDMTWSSSVWMGFTR